MADLSTMSDEDLQAVAGQSAAPSTSPDLSSMSDEELAKLANTPKATQAGALEYGVDAAVPFSKDIGSAIGAAESYLPKGLQVPGDVAPAVGDQDTFGQRFTKNKVMINAQDAANREEYPVTSFITPLATSVAALPVAGPIDALSSGIGAVAPRIAGLASDTLASGAVGAGYGALYGAGEGDTVGERLSNAGSGALMGGAGGALAPALAKGVGAVAGAVTKPFFGGDVDAQAASRIAGTVTADRAAGQGLSDADYAAAQASGQPVITGDIGGTATQRLAKAAANSNPAAEAALAGPLNERYEDQGPRVAGFLQSVYGNNLDAQATRDALASTAKSVNSPAYRQAYADGANGVWTPELESLVNSPNVQSAIKDATKTAANDAVLHGTPVVRNPFVPDAQGNLTLRTNANGNQAIPSLQFWDIVKRGLDDQAGEAFSKSQKMTGGQIVGLKNQLLSTLDNAVPSYATARQGAFKAFGADNALEAGTNFLKLANTFDTSQAKSALAAMTPVQQKLFSQGLASQMAQAAMNAPMRRNVLNMFNSPEIAQRLQMGLGPTVAPQVEAFLNRESIMDRFRTSMGNSTTAKQTADMQKGGHGIVGLITNSFSAPVSGAVAGAGLAYEHHGFDPQEMLEGAAGGALTGALVSRAHGVNQKLMKAIGEQLASPDPAVVNAAIKKIAQNPKMMNSLRSVERGLTYLGASNAPQAAPQSQQQLQPAFANGGP